MAGFVLARLYYGEFGVTERVAVMDVLGVQSLSIANQAPQSILTLFR